MAATITQGSDLMIFVSGKSIACATSCSLTVSTEQSDTSHKDIRGSWKSSSIKSRSWEVSSENLFATNGEGFDFYDLFDWLHDGTEVTVVFNTASNATGSTAPTGGYTPTATGGLTGKAIVTNLQANAPDADNATYSVTLTGVGELAKQS